MLSNMDFINKELEDVRKRCVDEVPGSEIVACHPAAVRIRIVRTKYKKLEVCMQFQGKYPDEAIIIEIKSKTIPDKLREGLTKICDEQAKTLLGKPQILHVVKFVQQFLADNPFSVCSEEVSFIKRELITEKDEIKMKQKSGVIVITIREAEYFMKFRLKVPDLYPEQQIVLENVENNFPELFHKMFLAQTEEMARRCVQPPLKRKPKDPPFEPSPSLKKVAVYLIDCLRTYPGSICPICRERAFTPNPEHAVKDETHGRFVVWVYCGHIFHKGCLDEFFKTPPFTGGKKCPSCGKRIYHDKWNITPKVAEERWAHQEARRRELDEVVDFLQ
ncbi:uncharacterized protein LOC121405854 [Lytechinus variegatus]|uniref:uncharacterized protein LOC121405854 n=1 Tax=Lytechinus variegatus TaxID=7654 RepID=UPI001BB23B94|nr:uncharacterized protein LOC121405854 [Lytechinus variegatus]